MPTKDAQIANAKTRIDDSSITRVVEKSKIRTKPVLAKNEADTDTGAKVLPKRITRGAAREILAELHALYPDAKTELNYTSPFELLVSVMLSAQATDVSVNKVTPKLFDLFPDAHALAKADVEVVDDIIRSIGLHRAKSKNAVTLAKQIVELHAGEVPRDRDALEALAGVGRKTASVVLSVAFEEAAFAVDTHIFRVSRRLGLSRGANPLAVEHEVTKLLPPELWRHAHHWLILHGRRVCKAPRPLCDQCGVANLCPSRAIFSVRTSGKKKTT